MGVVFSLFFALGLILIRQATDHVDLDPGCVLYGNIVLTFLDTVDCFGHDIPRAVLLIGAVLLLNLVFVLLFYKELKICAFDPALATTLGINASVMHYLLMVLVAVTTVANFESVGSILVIAMLIVPAASAYLLTDRLGVMIAISMLIAAVSAFLGHVCAVFGTRWVGLDMEANTAAMMTVVTGVILCGTLLLSPRYGLVSRIYHRSMLSLQIIREDILGLLYRWQELDPRRGEPMTQREVLDALGGGWLTRRALKTLRKRCEIELAPAGPRSLTIVLSDAGLAKAAQLVRSHRLWETYLAKHFLLPLDHLHMPAERMEHYISPDMHDELQDQLDHPTEDPQGKTIPGDESR